MAKKENEQSSQRGLFSRALEGIKKLLPKQKIPTVPSEQKISTVPPANGLAEAKPSVPSPSANGLAQTKPSSKGEPVYDHLQPIGSPEARNEVGHSPLYNHLKKGNESHYQKLAGEKRPRQVLPGYDRLQRSERSLYERRLGVGIEDGRPPVEKQSEDLGDYATASDLRRLNWDHLRPKASGYETLKPIEPQAEQESGEYETLMPKPSVTKNDQQHSGSVSNPGWASYLEPQSDGQSQSQEDDDFSAQPAEPKSPAPRRK